MDTKKICPLCNKSFSTTSTKRRHMRLQHNHQPQDEPKVKHIQCPLCPRQEGKLVLTNHEELVKHLASVHAVDVKETLLTFNHVAEFEAWRNEESRLVDYASQKRNKSPCGEEYRYYSCIRSDIRGFVSKSKFRKPKRGGSIRISGICPSRINAKILKNGLVTVKYIETHVGHDDDLELRTKRLLKAERLSRAEHGISVEKPPAGVSNFSQDTKSIGVLYEGLVWDETQSTGMLIGKIAWDENSPAEVSKKTFAEVTKQPAVMLNERIVQGAKSNAVVPIIVPSEKLISIVSIIVPGENTELSNERIDYDAKSTSVVSIIVADAKSPAGVSNERIIQDANTAVRRVENVQTTPLELNLLDCDSQSSKTINGFDKKLEIQFEEIRKYAKTLDGKSFDEFMDHVCECKSNFERINKEMNKKNSGVG